jgi:hypothetical protein
MLARSRQSIVGTVRHITLNLPASRNPILRVFAAQPSRSRKTSAIWSPPGSLLR